MTHLEFYLNTDPKTMTDAELDEALSLGALLSRLFDGLPRGTTLLDAALCKFHRGDALAIEFMQSHEVAA